MKLFNTLTNKKEEFKPLKEGEVSIYVCGPTVYNYVHIGNTRPMIVFDVLRRTFEYLGNKVTFVSNFTDVDDKIIKAAKQEGITEKELTDKYIKAYEDVRRGLNLEFPTYAPRVTETMDQIISFIQKLVDKGYAYVVDGDVYFRVSKVKEYGELSGIKIEDLVAGASERVEDKGVKSELNPTDVVIKAGYNTKSDSFIKDRYAMVKVTTPVAVDDIKVFDANGKEVTLTTASSKTVDGGLEWTLKFKASKTENIKASTMYIVGYDEEGYRSEKFGFDGKVVQE